MTFLLRLSPYNLNYIGENRAGRSSDSRDGPWEDHRAYRRIVDSQRARSGLLTFGFRQ